MAISGDEASDDDRSLDLFREPDEYYPPEKPASTISYQCRSGAVFNLRLVGHSPLWVSLARFMLLIKTDRKSGPSSLERCSSCIDIP